jgi:hypothetical protein
MSANTFVIQKTLFHGIPIACQHNLSGWKGYIERYSESFRPVSDKKHNLLDDVAGMFSFSIVLLSVFVQTCKV